MEELSKKEELEKRLINQSLNINSILSRQIKRKWCYFLLLTTKDTRHLPSTISSSKPIDFLSSILNTKFICKDAHL